MTQPTPLMQLRKYLQEQTGIRLCRATMYNWATKGITRHGQKYVMQTVKVKGQLHTTVEWCDNFVAVFHMKDKK